MGRVTDNVTIGRKERKNAKTKKYYNVYVLYNYKNKKGMPFKQFYLCLKPHIGCTGPEQNTAKY